MRDGSADPGERLLLTLNAGSSSLRFALFTSRQPLERRLSGAIERVGAAGGRLRTESGGEQSEKAVDVADQPAAAAVALDEVDARFGLAALRGAGSRIVHGGPRYSEALRVTPDVIEELRSLASLDPDHLPAELRIVEAVAARVPGLPQVACFDTAFHRALPPVARRLAIPRRFAERGVERYGFHGLSYTSLLDGLERLAGESAARGRVVLAHLGSGSSLAAVHNRRPLDTTMGFTPTSGVMMGTRSGDLDPGVLLYLERREGMDTDRLDAMLNRESGLLGVSATSGDMRDLLAREGEDERARDAIELYCHQVRKAVGAMAAVLGGIDTLVFAGGIGERSAVVRARIASGLEHLGVRLDAVRNTAGTPLISSDDATCAVRIIASDEESVIARQTLAVLGEEKGGPR